jgi:hypothetical protein
MKTINLSPLKNELENEELQEFDLGEIVEVPDGVGIIAAMAEETFEYPAGSADRIERIEEEDEDVEMEEIEASEDNPVYIVALQDGGSVAVTADEIDGDAALEDDDGADIESFGDIEDGEVPTELAPVYEYCDDPSSRASLEEAKRKYIHENYATELGEYVDNNSATLATLEEMPVEELVNIRGVDDPHVGLDELPPGWTRKSVLQAWASLGATFRTARARLIRELGPNFATRLAAALKDEVLRTEEWRGKF